MKTLLLILSWLLANGQFSKIHAQTTDNSSITIPIVSTAPVSYRVNESGSILHGYYKKGYNLTIYGDTIAFGFRADCDRDDDWSDANVGGTTQSSNSFESKYKCKFNPHKLYGTVLPGNKVGQNHFDAILKLDSKVGDLTVTYKLDKNNKVIDSIIGVVFDRGPHNQPGESSVAVCDKFKNNLDNNQFIYIVFPNSAKYVLQHIGLKEDNRTLQCDPLNSDFEQAYKSMLKDVSRTDKITRKDNLVEMLSQSALVTNYDNATAQEKALGKSKPKNKNKNINE